MTLTIRKAQIGEKKIVTEWLNELVYLPGSSRLFSFSLDTLLAI